MIWHHIAAAVPAEAPDTDVETEDSGSWLVTPSANNKLHTPSPSQGENQAMAERER